MAQTISGAAGRLALGHGAERLDRLRGLLGGYAGELPSWRLNKNMWHGLNLFPAVDGSLVPRSGPVCARLTGRAAGQIAGMGWADGGATTYDRARHVQGTAPRAFDPYTIGGAVAACDRRACRVSRRGGRRGGRGRGVVRG